MKPSIVPASSIFDRIPEGVFRGAGMINFALFVLYRLYLLDQYPNRVLYVVELWVPLSILWAYGRRERANARAHGFRGIVLPFIGSALPMSFYCFPPTAFGEAHEELWFWLLCAPTASMVWAYLTLKGSFAILADARTLRTTGPYRWVRHPAYGSQMLCGLVVLVWRFSWPLVGFYLLFVTIQYQRSLAEEDILSKNLPTYAEYQKRTWRFIPFLF